MPLPPNRRTSDYRLVSPLPFNLFSKVTPTGKGENPDGIRLRVTEARKLSHHEEEFLKQGLVEIGFTRNFKGTCAIILGFHLVKNKPKKMELDVATTGVTNALKFLSLVSKFHVQFSLKCFHWRQV